MKWHGTDVPAGAIIAFAVLAVVIVAINIAAFAGAVWFSVWRLRCFGVIS